LDLVRWLGFLSVRRLCRALAGFPAGDWPAALAGVAPALLQPLPVHDEWAGLSAGGRAREKERLGAALNDLLAGPLTWFGVFAPIEGDAARGLAFTPLGAALAGRDDGAWPDGPPAERR